MNPRRAKFRLALLLTVSVAAPLAVLAQNAPTRARSIEFSDSKTGDTSTATNTRAIRKLDPDIKKPFDIFRSSDLSDGPVMPIRMAPQPRRNQDRPENRKDWVFKAPEDYAPDLSAESMMGVQKLNPDGSPKEKQTPLMRFYDRLNQRAGETNKLQTAKTKREKEEEDEEQEKRSKNGEDKDKDKDGMTPWSSGMSPMETTLNRLRTPEEGALRSAFKDDSKSGSFWSASPAVTMDKSPEQKAQESRLEEFKQLLNFKEPGASGGAFADPVAKPTDGFSLDGSSSGSLFGSALSSPAITAPATLSTLPESSHPVWAAQPPGPAFSTPAFSSPAASSPSFLPPRRKF